MCLNNNTWWHLTVNYLYKDSYFKLWLSNKSLLVSWTHVTMHLQMTVMKKKWFFKSLQLFVYDRNTWNHSNESWLFDGIFIIKAFRSIVIVISTTFRPICQPAFSRCLSNSGTYAELRTTSFSGSTEVACSDSVSHNRVQALSIPVLLLACSENWTCNLQIIVSLYA